MGQGADFEAFRLAQADPSRESHKQGSGPSREALHTLVKNFPHGILALYDKDLRYTLMEGSGLAKLGLSPSDFVGKRLRDVFPPEVCERDEPSLLAALGGETVVSVVPYGPDTYRVTTLPIRGPGGDIQGGMVVSEDITELEEVKASLQKVQEKHELALKAAGLGVWHLDAAAKSLEWNDRMYEIYQVERSEQPRTPESWLEFVHPDDRPQARAVAAAAEGGEAVEGWTYRIIRPDGQLRHINGSVAPTFDASGRLIYLTGIDLDVTEQKAGEARAQEAQKLEALGQLTGGVAHDFNNLLQVILGQSDELLTLVCPGESAYESVMDIKRAGERAVRLVSQLLAFASRQVLSPACFELEDVVQSMLEMLRPLLGPAVRISVRSSPGQSTAIQADLAMVEQVIMNLCLNARDAMPEGGQLELECDRVHVSVDRSKQSRLSAGNYVRLGVHDNGLGMTPEVKARVFDPFFTTKRLGGGTGLGLATAYGIVHQHGGSIEVESTPGEGTAFFVYWPAPSAPAVRASMGVAELEDTVSTPPTRGSVLVVEDDELVRRSTTLTLRREGFQVVEAHDGLEALEVIKYAQASVDVVLLDYLMPRMNGKEAWEGISRLRPDLPMVMTSGFAQEGELGALLETGRVPFLRKPYDREALLAVLLAAMAGARRSA